MNSKYIIGQLFLLCTIVIFSFSCRKFVEVDPPRTALIKATVFESDATANAALLDIYYQLRNAGFASGNILSISFLLSLYSDEQISYATGTPISIVENQQFNDNALLANNSIISLVWSDLYKTIYKTNAVIEGLASSAGVSENRRKQLEGEAKFIRAFCHFYLVNLWNDVPLVLTTDYQVNSTISRSSKADVYSQIINDLTDAQSLLSADYSLTNGERVRANKWAATALLARAYLYKEDWINAEVQASAVINTTALYSLKANLNDVFLLNNTEAILQWWGTAVPRDLSVFFFANTPVSGAIRPQFANAFETGDLRHSDWVRLTPAGYYSTQKYSLTASFPPAQYSTVMRLAELFLVRAEARAKQGKITGANSAEADINVIRSRAGLGNTAATTQAAMLLAVEQEKRSELFNEWGHRWLDLKRTNRAAPVLSPIKPQWVSTAVLFPIPEPELLKNASLTQNQGY